VERPERADGQASLASRLEYLHYFHFELAAAESEDSLCRTLVAEGCGYVGVDRLGLWFLDSEDADWFRGSFGIDEEGKLRDERASRVRRDRQIYDDSFFRRRVQFRRLEGNAIYDDQQRVVGHGDLVVAPLWNGRESIGALAADNLISGRRLSHDDCQLVAILARMVGLQVTIKRNERELQRMAAEDGLTGLLNRATGMRVLEQQIAIARRTSMPLSIAFVDLDGLKRINDTRGHAAGDRFIRGVAAALDAVRRTSDVVCRMGGDEFMMIFPDTTAREAEQILRRARETSAASPDVRAVSAGPWFSAGIAELESEGEIDAALHELIRRADEAMYYRKREHQTGRRY